VKESCKICLIYWPPQSSYLCCMLAYCIASCVTFAVIVISENKPCRILCITLQYSHLLIHYLAATVNFILLKRDICVYIVGLT